MAEFVLEEAARPSVVRVQNVKGLLSNTVHLSDDLTRTLCGRTGTIVEETREGATCKRCQAAETGKSRVHRLYQ